MYTDTIPIIIEENPMNQCKCCNKTGIKTDNSMPCFMISTQFTEMFHVKQRRHMAARKAGAKPKKKQPRGRRKRMLPAVLLAIALLGCGFGWMAGSAQLAHLKYADVYLQDLPAAFDGTRVLYLSDISVRNKLDDMASQHLVRKLNDLQPDMLLLGGDYSANTLLETINGKSGGDSAKAQGFIDALSGISAPLGKFAVAGDMDDPDQLMPVFSASGVQLLKDSCAIVEKNGAELVIAGLDDVSRNTTPYEEIGGYFNGSECVLVLAHNPSAYVGVRVAEAKGGGAWADLVLSGHTLGGQIKLAGRTLRSYTEEEARCLAGWHYADDLPMLVSQGLGCQGAKLRLGTESEIWMITLRKPGMQEEKLPEQKVLPRLGG